MAVRGFKDRRFGFFAGLVEKVQTIKVPSGAAGAHVITTTIKPYGITVITSTGVTSTGGNKARVSLDTPRVAGIHKTIIVKQGTSAQVVVVNKSTATKFFGSTYNSIAFTKTALGAGAGNIELRAVSTAAWALMTPRGSTGGSTAHPASVTPFTFTNSSR